MVGVETYGECSVNEVQRRGGTLGGTLERPGDEHPAMCLVPNPPLIIGWPR